MMVLRDKCGHIFGAYVSESWEIKSQFYGRLKSSQILETRCVARLRPGSLGFNIIWTSMRETITLLLANNKGADQPAHTRSLISTFVIHYLKSNVTRSDIS